ncbi:hypothetical protein HDU96_001822, partial [Phlyctochytrium bullatum]
MDPDMEWDMAVEPFDSSEDLGWLTGTPDIYAWDDASLPRGLDWAEHHRAGADDDDDEVVFVLGITIIILAYYYRSLPLAPT